MLASTALRNNRPGLIATHGRFHACAPCALNRCLNLAGAQ